MQKILSKIQLQLYKIANRILFFILYPYLRPTKVLGLLNAKLPLIFIAGKGLKLIIARADKNIKSVIIEKGVWLGDDVELNTFGPGQIIIREGASVQDRCKLLGNVTLHRNVILAPNVYISSGSHHAFVRPHLTIREQDQLPEIRNFALERQNVIEEDCWLGINSYIKAGIYIGRGAVIGANATVSKDIPPYAVVVGNSKIIKSRIDFLPASVVEVENKLAIPYLYRGFSFSEGFWLADNLTIFAQCIPHKLRITYENYSGFGSLDFISSTGHGCTVQLAADSFFSEAVFNPCQKLIVSEIISPYFCLKMTSCSGAKPRLKKIEVIPL